MLGFIALALTAFMIFTLVRNALKGTQLSAQDSYVGTVELIIPITERSEFYLEPWLKSLTEFRTLHDQLKIHVLIDGHNPAVVAWQEVHHRLPFVELHTFSMRPEGTYPVPWMIQQLAPRIAAEVVIIGDGELVPNEHAFNSLAKLVKEEQRPYFVLPQTAQLTRLGEAVAVLNPTLALASVFGFRKYRRNLSHPLMSVAQGWMGMPLNVFQSLTLDGHHSGSWKQVLARQWDQEKVPYGLAFGERHLKRFYPETFKVQFVQLRTYWEELWVTGDRSGLWLFAIVLLIWAFPLLSYESHPFWAIATFGLLLVYRFFSKVVFQETWTAMLLHPIGCLVWLITFLLWVFSGLRSRLGTRGMTRY